MKARSEQNSLFVVAAVAIVAIVFVGFSGLAAPQGQFGRGGSSASGQSQTNTFWAGQSTGQYCAKNGPNGQATCSCKDFLKAGTYCDPGKAKCQGCSESPDTGEPPSNDCTTGPPSPGKPGTWCDCKYTCSKPQT